MTDPGARRRGLAVALALLVLLDVAIRRFDVFSPLTPDTLPSTLFAAVNAQLADLVRTLRGVAPGPRPVVLVGNSQMDMGSRPLPALRDALVSAGAPPDTRVVPLFVYATSITDAEVTARSLAALEPGLVVLGISGPDVGTTLERARMGPVVRILDTEPGESLVPPADLGARLDRWVRSVWYLYRYRALFGDLLLPPTERRTPRSFFDTAHPEAEFFAVQYGPERAEELLRLRRAYEQPRDWIDIARYVDAVQGPAYLPGLRDRWATLEPQPLQLEALRRFAAHVRAAGGTPVWVLLPENPLLERDPEIGSEVRRRSDAAARAVAIEARALRVPLLDLRGEADAKAFLDLNHLFFERGGLAARLAAALAAHGLLASHS